MKNMYAILALPAFITLGCLIAFIAKVRQVDESHYTHWNNLLGSIRLDVSSLDRAMLASRLNYSSSYDDISSLSQSLYLSAQDVEKLAQEESSLIQPRATVDANALLVSLEQLRHAIFDFNIEISTLRSARNVLYNTTNELTHAAEEQDKPGFALILLELETILLVDSVSTLSEKSTAVAEHLSQLEEEFPEMIAAYPGQWISITNDTAMIIEHSKHVSELSTQENIILENLDLQLHDLSSLLSIARAKTRIPEFIATGLLITELLCLAMFFLIRSSRLSRELKHHASELENIVMLRTQALELAMENLQESVEEKEKIAEDLRLSQRLEAIGQLAAGIAHEINTPSQFVNDNLQFILEAHTDLAKVRDAYAKAFSEIPTSTGNSKALEEIQDLEEEIDLEFLQDEIPSALKNSLEGMERISKIVKSMKDFSHPGSEGRDLIDINQAIETTLSVARNEWKYCANINKNLDADLPQVPALATELNQVLLNIIVNAAQAIEQKRTETDSSELGTISIETSYDENHISLRIRDSGCGIPQKNIDRVFDPFFTTKDVGKGTGQGLSIARKIVVDTHDGILEVTSELGEFTEFHICLPRKIKPPEATQTGNVVSEHTATETIGP